MRHISFHLLFVDNHINLIEICGNKTPHSNTSKKWKIQNSRKILVGKLKFLNKIKYGFVFALQNQTILRVTAKTFENCHPNFDCTIISSKMKQCSLVYSIYCWLKLS